MVACGAQLAKLNVFLDLAEDLQDLASTSVATGRQSAPRLDDLHSPVVSQIPAGPAGPTYESNLQNRVSPVSVAHRRPLTYAALIVMECYTPYASRTGRSYGFMDMKNSRNAET
jgi:hypothetical protein